MSINVNYTDKKLVNIICLLYNRVAVQIETSRVLENLGIISQVLTDFNRIVEADQ